MKKRAVVIGAFAGLVANAASAQSSVTLYGIIDTGVGYQNNVTTLGTKGPGHSKVQMISAVWAGSRFGLKGSEDLGGGTKTIFTLESGFNPTTGAQQYTNAMFGRQAFVGMTNPTYGTLTLGRQYTAYYQLLSTYSPTTWLTGYTGAHPGDIDSLDTLYRGNNSIVYVSPSYSGLTFAGSYSMAGVPGSINQGSTWSAALQYLHGPFGIAAGFQRINNSTPGGGAWGADSTANTAGEPGVSAINFGYRNAQAQQRVAVTGGWQITQTVDISASYSNVQYIPGINSGYHDLAIFNTVGATVHWKPTPVWDLAGGYAFTAATKANGISQPARYNQFSLSQYYSLSKRTGVYAVEGYQHASGKTFNVDSNGVGSIINAVASVGDGMNGTPSTTGNQVVVGVAMIHRF
ncbi:porin [Burkholderia multivorans]|uniref:porin n=1 Tax=Burkholderia multivorans TaxID=87883 RepID=UPI002ED4FAAA|nr:porin [Burkholderia multivorans]